jgi:hypothetical protein
MYNNNSEGLNVRPDYNDDIEKVFDVIVTFQNRSGFQPFLISLHISIGFPPYAIIVLPFRQVTEKIRHPI